jgi:hypothetical protein
VPSSSRPAFLTPLSAASTARRITCWPATLSVGEPDFFSRHSVRLRVSNGGARVLGRPANSTSILGALVAEQLAATRPRAEQIAGWARETGLLEVEGPAIDLPPWHYGLRLKRKGAPC